MSGTLTLPRPTRDVEQGRRDLDEYGLCVHEAFVEGDQLKALRERLVEQAELECEFGVALLSGQSRGGKTWYGHPEPDAMPGWQGIAGLYNKGRVFIDYLKHPLFAAYNGHVFRKASWHLSAMTGLIVRRGAEPMVVHVDQQFMPYTEVPTYLNAMLCLTEFEEVMGATRVVNEIMKSAVVRARGTPLTAPFGTESRLETDLECRLIAGSPREIGSLGQPDIRTLSHWTDTLDMGQGTIDI